MLRLDKSKFINVIIFLVVAILCVLFIYKYRCYVVNCSPASWKRIVDVVLTHANNDFQFGHLHAIPSHSQNSYTEAGPTFIEINVEYVSLIADEKAYYPTKFLKFDDRDLITKYLDTGNSSTNYVPPEDIKEKLKRVTVHPRDVFRLTWMLAEKETSLPAESANSAAVLIFNNVTVNEYGCESIWRVRYSYEHVAMIYIINAQTGEIVSYEKKNTY